MNVDRWKNRRRMAWLACIAGLAYPLLALSANSETLVGIAPAFYIFATGIVGAYIGFAAVDDKWQKPEA